MNKKGNEKPKFFEGQEVVLVRKIGGVVKGAKATITRIHLKPRFGEDVYLSSVVLGGGEEVVDLRLQNGGVLENVSFAVIKLFTRK